MWLWAIHMLSLNSALDIVRQNTTDYTAESNTTVLVFALHVSQFQNSYRSFYDAKRGVPL